MSGRCFAAHIGSLIVALSATLALTACEPTDSSETSTDAAPSAGEPVATQKDTPAPTPAPVVTQQTPPKTTPITPPRRIIPKRPAPAAVEQTTIDAGRVNPDELAHGVFKLTNRTGATLEVDRVHITCNCTRALPRQMSIPPRSEVLVDMYIDLRGTIGPFEKQAHVYFKGFPDAADLRLIGDFQFAISASPSPPRVNEDSKTGQIQLSSLDGSPFKVLSFDGATPTIVSRTPENADRYTECTIAYDYRDHPVPAAMIFITDHPQSPVIPLKIHGGYTAMPERQFVRTLKAMAFSRRFLNLGVIEPGVPMTYDMTVFREVQNHGVPLEIYFGRNDITATVEKVIFKKSASMFPKAQNVTFIVTSNITTPGEVFLTPIYMTFKPVDGSPPVTQRIWAAGISAGEHSPGDTPLMPQPGTIR